MKKILVIGHSHMNALKAAPSAKADFHFISFLECASGGYDKSLSAEFPGDPGDWRAAVFLLRGNVHIELGLVKHPAAPFDFCLPEAPTLPLAADATLLPASLIETILQRHLAPERDQLRELASRLPGLPCLRVESPPPLPDKFVESNPAGFATQVALHGVAPLAMRYKLWRLNSRLVGGHCKELDVGYLTAPAQAIDSEGCLAQAYRRPDPAHANHLYGELVLHQVRDTLMEMGV
jgi:hypothetical protein